MLTTKSEELIVRYPRLKSLQAEIDRILSNTHGVRNRQEVLDIMFKTTRDELHSQFQYLNKLLESHYMS
jgi:ATP phosphoribosyltransferase